MRRDQHFGKRAERGVAIVEFSFALLTLLPLMLGTTVIGVNMIRTVQTGQLARDAGHLFARGLDVSQPGNQTLLANVGVPLNLSTTGAGGAELIFSAITYVDKAACASVGAVDSFGNPSNCTNYGKWVFQQRYIVGNSSLLSTSSLGSPLSSGPTGVTVDPNTGQIAPSDYVLQSGAVATFNSINPYANTNGNISGLPSGQFVYVTEAGATSWVIPPLVTNSIIYAYAIF